MDSIGLWVGRALLITAFTFPVWGTIMALLLEQKKSNDLRKKSITAIQGSIAFWICNVLILEIMAGIFFLLLAGNVQAFTDHWRFFWNWGGWLVLAVIVGNGIAVYFWLTDTGVDYEDIPGFVLMGYFMSVVGAIVAVIIWFSFGLASLILSTPIPPAQ